MELKNLEQHLKTIPKDDWAKLFDLFPIIEKTEAFSTGGDLVEDENDPDNCFITPINEAKIVFDFIKIMEELDLIFGFDWSSWDYGSNIVEKGEYSNLDSVTLLKILNAFIRNNRFCEGALAGRFEDKSIETILKELKKNIGAKL